MTKVLKNILISLCGMFAFLFAGFFFVGCGIDYSKIQLTCDKSAVNLQVGESVDLIFKIENYQSGFSNVIDFNDQSSGLTDIFSCSKPDYLSEDEIKVTVTGVAGGSGKLEVITFEAGKTCEVNIFVEQFSDTMSFDQRVLYVSNKTEFVPKAGMYKFDTNTTYKELSYYYIQPLIDIDFNTFSLVSLDFTTSGDFAIFSDGVMQVLQVPVVKFDKVTLQKGEPEDLLKLHDGESVKIVDTVSEFDVLAIYDYSMNEDGQVRSDLYENIVYALSTVHVLPDLEVSVSGGYADATTGTVVFDEIDGGKIRIVPNNNEMNVYVVKIEMASAIKNLPIDFKMRKSNDYVDIDFFRDEDYTAHSIEKKDNVYCLKVTQNTQTQVHTDFTFEVYYNIAQDINDESVNVENKLQIDVEIAPIDLLVNGTSTPEVMTLYNFYKFPEYGWNEMVFDVISGLESSPNFNGIYFEFSSDSLEISCDGVNVSSGREHVYKDLAKSFYIRGAYGCQETREGEPVELKVHLESDILSGGKTEIVLSMYFDIVAGARNVWVNPDFEDLQNSFYLDLNGGEKSFYDETLSTGIIVADAPFQFITYSCEPNTQDVVDFAFDKKTICIQGAEYYYLNFKVIPKAVGSGIYTINLDNGMPITLTFNVIKTLTTEYDPFVLASTENEAVTEFKYLTDTFTGAELAGKPDYANILNIDILNPNKNGYVDFGARAGLNIVSNVVSGGVKFSLISGNISMSQGETTYYFSTRENGQAIVSATLTGYEVDERFTRQTKTLKYELRIASYSLLQEFYLKNGDAAALSNTVYYGGGKANNQTSATFTTYVDNKQTFGFYKYDFTDLAIQAAYEQSTELQTEADGTILYKYNVKSDEIAYNLKHEFYNDKFVYYYANSNIGVFRPSIIATITKNNTNAKKVRLEISSGLMFYAESDRSISGTDVDGRPATYKITFDNLVYSDSNNYLGEFDVESKTYTNIEQSPYTLRLNAYVRQRNLTKQYEVRIKTEQYKSIESISLASSISQLDFDNEEREYILNVYTYPQTSTSKNIEVVYVATNGNPYTVISGIDINSAESENGVYTVKLSCEDFFKNPLKHHKNYSTGQPLPNIGSVVDIEDALTGKIYIFPSEWGSSVSEIEPGLEPIVIDVQYRNGSKMNPYLIETAEDLRKINQNETTLRSHYEVNTVIDLASLTEFEPIGIINGEVVGFSGSIVGANSQATLANINITNSNFVGMSHDVLYGGLFAQLNDNALIENISFTGSFDLSLSSDAYLGMLASVNAGKISNVGIKVDGSIIDYAKDFAAENETLYFGGLTGINVGEIVQNFDLYDASFDLESADMEGYEGYNFKIDGDGNYVYEVDETSGVQEKVKLDENGGMLPQKRDLTGQTPKNLVFFNDFANINVHNNFVYAGGIAGASSGTIKRVLSDKNQLSLYGYSQYSAYSLIKVVGTLLGGEGKFVHVGGAVGIASFAEAGHNGTDDKTLPIADKLRAGSTYRLEDFNLIDNLLVGGEIDTTAISGVNDWSDYVGGIVGYVDSVDTDQIIVSSNISRTFLRAHYNVGGIVGYDAPIGSYGAGKWSEYLENSLEAIDDGKKAFYSSMIIKVAPLSGYTASRGTNFYFVGNALSNNRMGYAFEAFTYLSREKMTLSVNQIIDYNYANLQEYYGDYLVVKKEGASYKFVNNCYQFYFTYKDVEISLDATKDAFLLTSATAGAPGEVMPDVYFMYYFSVDAYLNSDIVVDNTAVDALNVIAPTSVFYPFALTGDDVVVTSLNSEILTIDMNGVITVRKTGFATVELTSIKNTNKTRKLYIYVVNYFDKNTTNSMFYSSKSSNAINLTDGSLSIVYGNSKTNVYLVPTYSSASFGTYEELDFAVSQSGILKYQNVDYVLTKNIQLKPLVEKSDLSDDYFSDFEIVKQTISFFKDKNIGSKNDDYSLTPKLEITFKVDGKEYTYVRNLSATVNLEIEYREKASQIYVDSEFTAIKSNEYFNDKVTVVSTNPEEKLFYQIFYNGDLVQDRLPAELGDITNMAKWDEYINFKGDWADNNNLYEFFDINFVANGDNTFGFSCEVNQSSERFENRFNQDIFGEYVVYLYASDLGHDGGVSTSFVIDLSEADLNYVKMKNYSNIDDVSVEDDRLVPSQRGLLEIGIDPIEAVFDEVVISNSKLNYNDGATEASLTFVYKKVTQDGVEYVLDPNFGTFNNGSLKFNYLDMLKHYEELNEVAETENARVNYSGKIYVSYFMPATNVSDAVPVGFDISVGYGDGNAKTSSVRLTTKLGNYARLKFDDRDSENDVYYVARGLSYGLTLEYFGFTENEVSITSSNASLASISGANGKYVLNITSNNIPYYDDIGYKIEIETLAQKIVDDVLIVTKDVLTVYIMEYALNYVYIEGVNEDVVKGMDDGVISTAVGNPYTLEFDIYDFLEFDKNNQDIVREVNEFASEMTQRVDWTVYYNKTATTLKTGKEVFRTDYYSIEGLIVTPLKVYSEESDVYYFSMDTYYTMKNGVYTYSAFETSNRIYTEFEFDVHDQSTEDSPIPIYTYEEFMNMEEGQWYILLEDIKLLGENSVSGSESKAFTPIAKEISGLDGNGKKIIFGDTYNFTGLSEVGVFESVGENTVLKNVTIELSHNTIFKMDQVSFEVGLLAAENSGIVTNCVVQSVNHSALSVVSTASVEGCYVAGLVAANNAYITHSRSTINIFTNANLSGFVATNGAEGVIASSYYKGASLKNRTNTAEVTAGLVLVNEGVITTSYVSGETDAETMYYAADPDEDKSNIILSSFNISGFVYTNTGKISDCYSNILLKQSGAFASGFVFENSGNVERCFSTSVFESEQSSNYGFARTNYIGDVDDIGTNAGVIEDCYYLKDETHDINTSIGQIIIEDGDTNVDLKHLSIAEFAKLDKFFTNYVYPKDEKGQVIKGRNINSVWFFNDDKLSVNGFREQEFNTGRLELVAPNLLATSERILDHVESITDESGASYSRYVYIYKSGTSALGSEENPITITSAEDFEEYILQENNKAGYNYSHYRLVSDINYSEYLYNGKTYNTKFMGYLEGNFMDIDGISFVSSEGMKCAGLFAEVGNSSIYDAIGTLMNFTIRPEAVSFSNASIVGAVAGKLDGGTIYNVSVETPSNDRLVAVGQNIVGGAIGLAIGNYKIENLYSQLGAKARNQWQDHTYNEFNVSTSDYSMNSFAGSIIGVLSGSGTFRNGVTDTAVAVLADKAGLMFGHIDANARVENLQLYMLEDMVVNAYSYGGLVTGESKGLVSDVVVNSFDAVSNSYFENFRKVPLVAEAVGGYAGLVSGGEHNNIQVYQSMMISNGSETSGIKYLGAIAGQIQNSVKFENLVVSANLTGFKYVGGVVGNISSEGSIEFVNVNVNSALEAAGLRESEIGLGGIAGLVASTARIVLKTEFTDDNLYLNLIDNTELQKELAYLNEKIEALRAEMAELTESADIVAKQQEIDAMEKEILDKKTEIFENLVALAKLLGKNELYNTYKGSVEEVVRYRGEIDALKEQLAELTDEAEIEDKLVEIEMIEADFNNFKVLNVPNAITRLSSEIKVGDLLDPYMQRYNTINVTVSTNVSVYSSAIRIYVGAIVGMNNATLEHSVCDTNMSLIGTCKGFDYGEADETIVASVNVDEQNKVVPLFPEGRDAILSLSTYGATRTTHYCSVEFQTTGNALSNALSVSFFGEAKYQEQV